MKLSISSSVLVLTFAASSLTPLAAQEHPSSDGGSGSGWTFVLGAMGSSRPKYLGSDETEFVPDPFLMLDYKGIVGIQESRTVGGAVGLYVRPLRTESWTLGVLALPELGGRDEDSAKALKGMGDRSANLFVGMDLTYRIEPFSATLEVLKGTKTDSGMLAGLSVGHSRRLTDKLGLELGLTGVWGNKDYQAWEFGITPAQAARRQALISAGNSYLRPADARPYTPKAGMREVQAEVGLNWQVSEKWLTFAMIEHGRLLGDAAKSPLTRSKSQTSASMGFGYRFAGGHDAD